MRDIGVNTFRKYSEGYTGQPKTAFRNDLSYDMGKLKQMKEQIISINENNMANLDAFTITQYLRGELYVYIDFLLGESIEEIDENVMVIYDFLKEVINLIVLWLKMIPKLYISVIYNYYYIYIYI